MKQIVRLQSAIANLVEALNETPLPGVDVLATLSACASDLDKISAEAKGRLRAAMLEASASEISGVRFVAALSETVRASVDVKKLRAELPDIAARYTQSQTVQSVRFKARGV